MRKIIDKGLELSLIFLMAFLVVDVLWQVLSRYILVSPSSVTDEQPSTPQKPALPQVNEPGWITGIY